MTYKNEPFSEFLSRIMADVGLTNKELAAKFKISSQAVSLWRSGKNRPKSAVIDDVRSYLLSLANGERASFMAEPKLSHLNGTAGLISIPELDVRAAAGDGLAVEEMGDTQRQWMIPLVDLLGLSDDPKSLRIISVEGDSMEPDYLPGDKIIINTALRKFTHDGVYVLDFGFGLVVKHLQLVLEGDPKKVLVVSTNPIYQPQEIILEKAQIKGKVVAKWQRR